MVLGVFGLGVFGPSSLGANRGRKSESTVFHRRGAVCRGQPNSPLLQAARLEAQAGTIDVAAIERQRWPTLSAVVESDTGNTSSLPSRSLRVQQIVWDAGLVSS